MSEELGDCVRARLIRAVVQSYGFASSRRSLEEIDRRAQPLFRELSRLLDDKVRSAELTPEFFESLRHRYGSELVEAASLAFLLVQEIGICHSTLEALECATRNSIPTDSIYWVYLKGRLSHLAMWSNALDRSEKFLEEAEFCLSGSEPRAARELAWPMIGLTRGLLEQHRGDFFYAASLLEDAHALAKSQGNRIAARLGSEWGTLLWSSGQVARALEVHSDAEIRACAAKLNPKSLLRLHLSAAKCALDLEDFETAERELREAEQIQQESESISEFYRGYYLLNLGEYHLASRTDERRGFELVDSACTVFEQLDPPHHAGVFEGKIVIAKYTLRFDDHRKAMLVLRTMLDEATDLGCFDARSKLLLLESQMYISETPPVESAFEDLAARVSLINNPAQMLEACANLYLYSLRYLDESQQAFMMGRLRRLEAVLDHRWYRDLYERHIERRYYWAVEGRLADYLERDEKLFPGNGGEPQHDDLESTS